MYVLTERTVQDCNLWKESFDWALKKWLQRWPPEVRDKIRVEVFIEDGNPPSSVASVTVMMYSSEEDVDEDSIHQLFSMEFTEIGRKSPEYLKEISPSSIVYLDKIIRTETASQASTNSDEKLNSDDASLPLVLVKRTVRNAGIISTLMSGAEGVLKEAGIVLEPSVFIKESRAVPGCKDVVIVFAFKDSALAEKFVDPYGGRLQNIFPSSIFHPKGLRTASILVQEVVAQSHAPSLQSVTLTASDVGSDPMPVPPEPRKQVMHNKDKGVVREPSAKKPVYVDGILYRKAGMFGRWKKDFYVFDHGTLTVKTKNGGVQKIFDSDSVSRTTPRKSSVHNRSLRVILRDSTTHLFAFANEADYQRWIPVLVNL